MERVKVKFWIDQNDHSLHVQNTATDEVKTIQNQKKIAFFLNANDLTADQVRGPMNGYDVLELFKEKKLLDLVPFLNRKREE